MDEISSSTPTLAEFNPRTIPFQLQVIKDIRTRFNYSNGPQQILLSGAVGSAKSLLMAHLIITHCLLYPGANVGIGRKTKPALRTTLIDKMLQHLRDNQSLFTYNRTTGAFFFVNGSRIHAYSWGDNDYMKVRSEEFSMFAVEELVENDDSGFYIEILMRLGRLTHIKECFLISCTNPDEPDHWVYTDIIDKAKTNPNIHIYYSKTKDNIFLPDSYIKSLEENLDPKMSLRMLYGKWIAIRGDKIYYNYDAEINFIKNKKYNHVETLPIHVSHDFNIAVGKPMSACVFQFEPMTERFYVFDEFVVHGANTNQIMQEIVDGGIFDLVCPFFIINGDSAGKARQTGSKKSDYDIIKEFLDEYERIAKKKINYKLEVSLSNPPIRKRHNVMNSLFKNVRGTIRLYIYEKCKMLHKGLMLSKLLDGAKYAEDDSKEYQHVCTAIGYGVIETLKRYNQKPARTTQL